MAIADFDAFIANMAAQPQVVAVNVAAHTVVAGRPYDQWVRSVPVGVAPTASVVPTNDTQGSLGQRNGGSGRLSVMGARWNAQNAGTYIIADRLVHSGGLSGTVTTPQTTNLPSTALTRHTSGEGVMVGLTIYTQIGTTATTVSISYTNQAGTSGRTSPLVAIGATGFREAIRMILIPLQEGDTGVRAVASVTLTATTGTAGNFGVTLFKPLFAVCVSDISGVCVADFVTGNFMGGIPEIIDDACLYPICISVSTGGAANGALIINED